MIDFFLVGAPKAGTTTLYKYLESSTAVFAPEIKEPNYYIEVGPQKRNVAKISSHIKYAALYKKAMPNQLKGDFSVSYMHAPETPEKIYKDNPNAKIIMVLRDPVLRAYSHWLMDKREGFTNLDFESAFFNDLNFKGKRGFCFNSMYYDCGLYADAINQYQAYFENCLILVYEEVFDNLEFALKNIFRFLNIEGTTLPDNIRFNESGEAKNKFLKSLYQNTIFRSISKNIFTEEMKLKIRKSILKKTDTKLKKDVYDQIAAYFSSDVHEVRKLLGKNDLWPNIQ